MTQEMITKDSMKTFTTIWFGQLVSSIGSGLTQFALSVWVYQETQSVTLFGLILLFSTLPGIFLFPITGALVDRWDRRQVLIVSDAVAAAATLAVVLLLWQGVLAVWHIYIVTAVISTAHSFQYPAFSASVTLLVSQKQLGRASGMMQFNEAATGLVAPLLAGFLLTITSLQMVILIDVITFLVAVLTLGLVHIPSPTKTADSAKKQSLWREAAYGWHYLKARKGFVALLIFFAIHNFLRSTAQVLFTPLILSTATTAALGTVMTLGGVGMLVGSSVMSKWGGPQRRIRGILGLVALYGVFVSLFGLGGSVPVFMVAAFSTLFLIPMITASNQALWQSKVSPEVQGRVFSMRYMIAWSIIPLAYVMGGTLADGVFKPLLTEGGVLARTVIGQWLGVGPENGIRLLYITVGALNIGTAVLASFYPRLWRLEEEIPSAIIEPSKPVEKTAELPAEETAVLEGAIGGAD